MTRVVEEDWLNDCPVSKFKKMDSIMIWGGILGAEGSRSLFGREMIWTMIVQTFVNYNFCPINIGKAWHSLGSALYG